MTPPLGVLIILTATPTERFLALSPGERRAVLARLGARLQEWTGEDGGVVFSERVNSDNGGWFVVLCISVRSAGLLEAVIGALQDEGAAQHFTFWGVSGDLLAITPDTPSADVTERIYAPFLD